MFENTAFIQVKIPKYSLIKVPSRVLFVCECVWSGMEKFYCRSISSGAGRASPGTAPRGICSGESLSNMHSKQSAEVNKAICFIDDSQFLCLFLRCEKEKKPTTTLQQIQFQLEQSRAFRLSGHQTFPQRCKHV